MTSTKGAAKESTTIEEVTSQSTNKNVKYELSRGYRENVHAK